MRLLADEPDIDVIGECADGHDAVTFLQDEKPDLVFLDIQMPHFDGFEVLKQLSSRQFPLVIFVTAYDQYAVKAFDFHAFDYLLKPFRRERFSETVSRVREHFAPGRAQEDYRRFRDLLEHWESPGKRLESSAPNSGYLHRVFVRTGKASASLEVSTIDWIKSVDHFVELHSHSRSYLVYSSIGDFERKLNPALFLRIHRTTIVNVSAVKEFRIDENGACSVVVRDGNILRVSRSRRRHLQTQLKDLTSQK